MLELGEPAEPNITKPVIVMVEEQLMGKVEGKNVTREDSVDVQVREDGGISSCMYTVIVF